MTKSAESEKIPASVRWAFVLGGAAVSASMQVVTVLALRFLTDDLGISAALAALLFAITQIYNAFVDPLVGYASDRTTTRMGRRRPYLLASGILMPLSILGLFAAPQIENQTLMAAYIGVMLIVHATGYSLYFVPAAAMAVEVTDDYHARSGLITVKLYGSFAGQILGSSVPPWLLAAWGGGRSGHASMAIVIAAIVGFLALASVPLLRKARGASRAVERSGGLFGGLLEQVRMAWDNKPFRIMVFVHLVFTAGVATASSTNAYFTRYVLHRTDAWLGSFYIFLTIGNLIALPFWLWLSKRIDKKKAYSLALSVYGLSNLSWILSGPSETLGVLGFRVTIIGIGMSGLWMLAQSMLTDAIRFDYVRTGLRREGGFSGFMSLIDKLSNAVGLIVMGALLSSMGYAASLDSANQVQSQGAITAIYWSFGVIPAITTLMAVAVLHWYKLTEKELHAAPAAVDAGDIAVAPGRS